MDRLDISIDAATPETYKKIRGGDLLQLERNIDNFLQIRNERGSETPILRVSFCVQNDNVAEKDAFLKKWEGRADIVDFQDLLDLSHILKLADMPYKEYICPDPFQRLVIDYKGNIYGCCCIGYNKYNRIGNISEMTLLEAWNSYTMKELRDSFKTQKLKQVCLNCRANRGM